MAVKTDSVKDWIRVLVPVVYLFLVVANSTTDELSWEIKYYYYGHRALAKLTRWSRKTEAEYMERYYELVNGGY